MTGHSIAEGLKIVHERIAAAAASCGRLPGDVRLVAVSKTHSSLLVNEAASCGQHIFGENYVQEFTSKAAAVMEPVEWHFIGHLQSNKVKQIAGLTSMIHSVDRISLAEEISRQYARIGKECSILVQVNISGEASKSGTTDDGALELIRTISRLPNIMVQGLMTMPPFFDAPEAARPFFEGLRNLAEKIAIENIPKVEMRELSMGMSGDFEVAIQEGATLVRVGTAIFGER